MQKLLSSLSALLVLILVGCASLTEWSDYDPRYRTIPRRTSMYSNGYCEYWQMFADSLSDDYTYAVIGMSAEDRDARWARYWSTDLIARLLAKEAGCSHVFPPLDGTELRYQ